MGGLRITLSSVLVCFVSVQFSNCYVFFLSCLNSNTTLPTYKHLHCNLILGHMRWLASLAHALTPLSFTPTSFDTISTLTSFHLDLDDFFSLYVELWNKLRSQTFFWFFKIDVPSYLPFVFQWFLIIKWAWQYM